MAGELRCTCIRSTVQGRKIRSHLFAASVLCENLRQDATARQILEVLLARYPEHPVAGKARQLATVIDKLTVPATA